MKSEMCKKCIHTNVCFKDKNVCGDVFVPGNPMIFDNNELYRKYEERKKQGFPCNDYFPVVVRCKDCKHWAIHKRLDIPWCRCLHSDMGADDYCSYAELRGDSDDN